MKDLQYERVIEQSLQEIRRLKSQLKQFRQLKSPPIAVIGVSGRFPENTKAFDNTFWEFLKKGKNAIKKIPRERWDFQKYYRKDQSLSGYSYSPFGSFLEGFNEFDAPFFGISPREASCIDPQHRFMIECTWEALEDAGIPPNSLKGKNVGVFMAQSSDDYHQLTNTLDRREDLDYYSGTGTSRSMLSGRISYILGIHGPSLQIDTSCSSSLIAVHLAVQSLRNNECDIAIVGGVQMNLSPMSGILRSRTQALSPDGQCKAFSNEANGFVQGEGLGVLILRKLEQALIEDDPIYCLIVGSAINHDGASTGLTAPNEMAQVNVIRKALEDADLKPEDINFIETHGTGTVLGDPIEINALNAVYGVQNRKFPIFIGSIKSNFGHMEAASGIASVIKTILVLKNKLIPPHLFSNNLNKHIDWKNLPFIVPKENFNISSEKFFAGVSSFGMSGTNAHVILQSFENTKELKEITEGPFIFVLSAKNKNSLEKLVKRYISFLKNTQNTLGDICYTTGVGRQHFKVRLTLQINTFDELIEKLQEFNIEEPAYPTFEKVYIKNEEGIESNIIECFCKLFPCIGILYKEMNEKYSQSELFQKIFGKFAQDLGVEFILLDKETEPYLEEKEDSKSFIIDKNALKDYTGLCSLIGKAYVKGLNINWDIFYKSRNFKRINLPPYTFDSKVYWPKKIKI